MLDVPMYCKVYQFGLHIGDLGRNYKNPCKEKPQLPHVLEFFEDPFMMTLEHRKA